MKDQPSGREPLEARSAIGLRRVLSVFGLVFGVAVTVVFAIVAVRSDDPTGPAIAALIGVGLAVIAVIDLLVLRKR